MKKIIFMMSIVLLLLVQSEKSDANTINYVLWKKSPITVALPQNGSKDLQFEHPVAVGIPNALHDKLTVKNQAGIVTLTTNKPFKATRLEVKDTVTGTVFILNTLTSSDATTVPLAVLTKAPVANNDNTGWLKTPNALKGQLAYATLTRFAEQALYAPKRLQKNPFGIQLTQSYVMPNGGVKPDMIFHNLFYDHSTINLPWATWRGGNAYVTAVIVRNVLNTPIDLRRNLTLLCGHDNGTWKAVTFFPHWQLSKAGSENDSTVAFLVSTLPFHNAQQSCEIGHE